MGELLGVVIADRYELTGVLGHGGQGVVYRARDRTAGREVAIKMLSDSVADDPVYAARLAREQEALVALAGTSAVTVYDLCEAPNGSLCLVMELLEGTDLETYLGELEGRSERIPFPRINALFAPIVATLERAHDVGIIHRDLKPGNIFILRDSQGVRLFDFGLSRSRKALRLTHAGTVMGSPSYIAPEVWKGDSDVLDGRVDVYSLGVILFRVLSGRLPFVGRTLKESFELASSAERPSLYALRKDLSPRVDAWVSQALAIDRDRRYQTARGLWNGLLKALEYHPPPETIRPVAESLVGAWRAATFAFRKLVERATAAMPAHRPSTTPPESLSPKAEEVAAVDEGWVELTEEDEVKSSLKRPVRTAPPPRRRSTAAPKADSTSEAVPHVAPEPVASTNVVADAAAATKAAPERTPSTNAVADAAASEQAVPEPGASMRAVAEPANVTEASNSSEHASDDAIDRPSFFSTADDVKSYLSTTRTAATDGTPEASDRSTKNPSGKDDRAAPAGKKRNKKEKRRRRNARGGAAKKTSASQKK